MPETGGTPVLISEGFASDIARLVDQRPTTDASGKRRRLPFLLPTLVKVTSALTGAGKYNGVEWLRPVTIPWSITDDVTEDDFGSEGGACYVINSAEIGTSSHGLTSGTPIIKIWPAIHLFDAPDGKPVYAITGNDDLLCALPGG